MRRLRHRVARSQTRNNSSGRCLAPRPLFIERICLQLLIQHPALEKRRIKLAEFFVANQRRAILASSTGRLSRLIAGHLFLRSKGNCSRPCVPRSPTQSTIIQAEEMQQIFGRPHLTRAICSTVFNNFVNNPVYFLDHMRSRAGFMGIRSVCTDFGAGV